jgi:tetratricopeptide (TPR) repeat protein
MIQRLVLLILAAPLFLLSAGSSEQLTLAGIREFNAAYQQWDSQRFGAAAELFCQAGASDPGSWTNAYWLGVAQFHRVLQLRNGPQTRTNAPAAAEAMDAAISAFQRALGLHGKHAESHALLGTLYGMKIDGNLLRAVRFGPRVDKHRRAALKWGAENPRVQYLLGTCQFHTANKPSEQREALASFLAAEKLFEIEAKRMPSPFDPRWGYSTCLTFVGRTYELLGERTEAAGYYRKAVAMHPADHLAKEGLARVSQKQ